MMAYTVPWLMTETMAGVRKEEYAKVFTELEVVAKVQSGSGKVGAGLNVNSQQCQHQPVIADSLCCA